MNVKGAIVAPVRPTDMGDGLMLLGRKAGLIVYVRGTNRAVKEFFRFCNRWELDYRVAGTDTDELVAGEPIPDAWEVLGDIEALARLMPDNNAERPSFVLDAHLIFAAKPPRGGQGSGPEKARASAPKAAKAAKDNTSDYTGSVAGFATTNRITL